VQGSPAHQLHIKVTQAEGSGRCFPYGGEGFGQELIQLRTVLVTLPETVRFFPQFSIREGFE
jgi:hypothetical protein